MGANSRIDLLIPGLFGPVPVLPENLPDLPSLTRLLSRADVEPAPGSDPVAVLFHCFGIELDSEQDVPSAPFSLLADAPNVTAAGFWLHADPVHLRPNRHQLLLFDARHLKLEREEADSLAALFNGHFAADGLRLEAPTAERWYLHVDAIPRLRTRGLADMVGQAIDLSYLGGEDAARWMGWLNEAQMLFHHADVNRQRELSGRLTVSGIWPWGGGSLPAEMPHCRYRTIFARDPLALGLAKAARIAAQAPPDHPQAMLAGSQGGQVLSYWDRLWLAVLDGDAAAWVQALSQLASWLDELIGLLKRGEVAEVALFPCDGTRLALTTRALRRFWRRSVRIESRLQGMT